MRLFWSAVVVSLLNLYVHAAVPEPFLKGVSSIDSDGVPGVVLCVGKDAFPIVVGKAGKAWQPVVAGTLAGKGKAVAYSHPSFIHSSSLQKADTERFMRHVLTWLGAGKIGIYAYPNAENGLLTLGDLDVHVLTSLEQSADCQVLVIYPDNLKDSELAQVRRFMENGGGVLAGCIGWGWQQLNPGKTLKDDSPFNRLMAPLGLVADNETTSRTGNGYKAMTELPETLQAWKALELAKANPAKTEQETAKAFQQKLSQINSTLLGALSVLSDEHQLARELHAFMAADSSDDFPTPKQPWRSDRLALRLKALSFIHDWQSHLRAPHAMHPGAQSYPGMPAEGYQLTTTAVTMDLSVPRWHSTGMFAVAGKSVTMILSQPVKGLRLRIGTTTCNNTAHDTWTRMPKVDMEVPLNELETTVTSPFGGLIYIVVPGKGGGNKQYLQPSLGGQLEVTIKNACKAVWYKIGRDKLTDWQRMLAECPAPQGEIESDNVILTVSRRDLQTLENPDELMSVWKRITDLDATLTNLPLMRPSAERFCADDQLCAGWMHAGYPIMIPSVTAKDLVNAERLRTKGDWGFFHEMGHNHQNGDWTFAGTGEVTVNFFSLYVLEKLCGQQPRQTRMTVEQGQRLVARWLKNGKTYEEWKREPFLALEMFVRLQVAYGWETFEKLFVDYRRLTAAERPKNDDEKRDQWCIRLSKLTGENIAEVFTAWSIPISDRARAVCAKYPRPRDTRLFEGL